MFSSGVSYATAKGSVAARYDFSLLLHPTTFKHPQPRIDRFRRLLSVVYSPGRKPPSAATVSKLAQVLPRVPNQPETEEMQDMHPFCQGLRELPVLCTECTDA